ncbi:MAG: protease inhibitor I42 family protein [Nitrospira sp.]|nr:protease inhibitor I42 family protein [Nitrospira sp.]
MNTASSEPVSMYDAGDSRTVVVDHPFVLQLWEDRTRGEQWVASYDARGLALLSDDFLRVASNNAVENGQRIFEFKAVQPGVHQILFEKRMGWKFTSEDRRLFKIEAQPPAGN